jgi:chemotaxis signal transduction protein
MSLAQRAGVFSDTQSSDRLEQETASQPLVDDRQMLLLFQIGDNGRMAIPMSVVVRLEEFPRATIEQVGEQMVIQYRDQILPLIDLATMFHTEVRSQEKGVRSQESGVRSQESGVRSQEKFICSLRSGQALYPTVMSSVLPPTSYSQGRGSPSNFHPEVTAYNTVETDIIQVVVVSRKDGRNVGLVVSQILDIVMESLNVTGAASRQGVEAIAVIQGQVTELLDLEAVCQ